MIILRDKNFACPDRVTYRHLNFAREWIKENPSGTKEEFLKEVTKRKLKYEHLYHAAFIRVKAENYNYETETKTI